MVNNVQLRQLLASQAIARTPDAPRGIGHYGVLLLAILVIVDPILNQISTAYELTMGSLSLLQATRGVILVVVLWLAVALPPNRGLIPRMVSRLMLLIGGGMAVIAINDVISSGLEISNIIAYVQVAYWLIIWYVAVQAITDRRSAMIVAKGLVIGALITAASVYYGYLTGTLVAVYSEAGVEASAGWFVSAKGIAGSLVAGGLVVAYLGARRHTWLSVLVALFCMGASFLTYARSGLVAMCAALVWLFAWSMSSRFNLRASWASRLVLASVCGALVLGSIIGTSDLATRWADINDPSNAGSGRLLLWNAAAQSFVNGSVVQKLMGRGFQGMLDMVYASLGIAIHTHNDLLDMLVVGGVLGVIVLGLVFAGLVIQIRGAKPASPEFAVAVAILLVLGCQAFFTGQLFLPDVMTFYLLAITSVLSCAREPFQLRPVFVRSQTTPAQNLLTHEPEL